MVILSFGEIYRSVQKQKRMEGSITTQGGRIGSSECHGAHHTQKEAHDEANIAAPSFLTVVEEKHLTDSSCLVLDLNLP